MAEPNKHRRFEFKSDRSYKFWEFTINERFVTVRHGRIGTKGSTKIHEYESASAALHATESKASKKRKGGYQEVIKTVIKRPSNEELWEELKPHEPFLQSILESPDDLDQYLVYADWLLEQGNPRGQFILSQIAINDPQTPMWEQTNHRKLANQLQMTNWRSWLGDLTHFLEESLFLFEFQRGFVSTLEFPYLTDQLSFALKNSPHCRFLRKLVINSTPCLEQDHNEPRAVDFPDSGLQLLRGAELPNLRQLQFKYNENATATRPAKHTFEIIHSMKRLSSLKMHTTIAEKDFEFLFSKEMPNLTELHIQDPVGNAPIEFLCHSSWMEQLSLLKLQCELDDGVAQTIADTLNPNVMERIDLQNNQLSEEAINTIEKTGVTVEYID